MKKSLILLMTSLLMSNSFAAEPSQKELNVIAICVTAHYMVNVYEPGSKSEEAIKKEETKVYDDCLKGVMRN